MRAEWLDPTAAEELLVFSPHSTWKKHPFATVEDAKAKGIGMDKGMTWQEWATALAEGADISENRRTVFTDASVLDDGRAGAGWSVFKGDKGRLPLPKGRVSGDAETIACIESLKGKSGPWLVLTDSTTAWDILTSENAEVPPCVAEARKDPRDIVIGWVKGHSDIEGNETADLEAKEAANQSDPEAKMEDFTLAWAKKKDSDLWNEDKKEPYWGGGNVLTWRKANARTLLRVRQAYGKCVLCGEGEEDGNNTRHLMTRCPALEGDREVSGLFNPNGPQEGRGHPGWESWLSEKEHRKTEKFLARLAEKWREKGAYPQERGVEPYGDKVARDGTEGLEDFEP